MLCRSKLGCQSWGFELRATQVLSYIEIEHSREKERKALKWASLRLPIAPRSILKAIRREQ